MSYLLDTHAILWFASDDSNLTAEIRSIIRSDAQLYVSSASIWELVIKHQIGKLKLSTSVEDFIISFRERFKTVNLAILDKHLFQLQDLALIHKDPFDRLLISQAISENLILMSKDEEIAKYPVKTIWK